jgi:hypothetical protein
MSSFACLMQYCSVMGTTCSVRDNKSSMCVISKSINQSLNLKDFRMKNIMDMFELKYKITSVNQFVFIYVYVLAFVRRARAFVRVLF